MWTLKSFAWWATAWAAIGVASAAAWADPVATLWPKAPVVADAGASGGKLVRVDLDKVKAGPAVAIPLGGKRPGKYIATLRVKLTPVDSDADAFVMSAGNGTRTFLPTSNPDAAGSDYRLWVLPFVYDGKGALTLTVTRTRPAQAQDQPAKVLLLDRLDVQSVGSSYIESIRPNKVCYDPGEDISCVVVVHEPRAEMEVRAMESVGLAEPREVARAKAAAGKVTLTWNAGATEYGREVRVELLERGKAVDAAADYYNVTDNVWKVAMVATVEGMHMSDPRSVYCSAKTDEQLAKNINVGTRATYGNFKESFAWAPDDVFNLTPTEEYWISGQGCYQHERKRLLLMNKLLLDNGVWPITYAKSAASGPGAFEYHRKHPEQGLSQFQSQFDQEYVEKWDRQVPGQEKTIFYTWMSCVLNVTDPKAVDAAIGEILASGEMFGWRGARYDDHYTLWGQPRADLSTRNMERIFELGKQRNPKFVWGFNYLTGGVPFAWPGGKALGDPWKQGHRDGTLLADPVNPQKGAMPEAYPEFAVACKNGGFIMNEEARGAWQNGGTYSNYAQLLTYEARLTRGLGGHYGPIPFDPGAKSAFDALYPDLLRAASRSHTYGAISGGREMLQFLTRYSGLIYGTGLEPIPDPEGVLTVTAEPGVWWHNYCYTYQDGGKKKIVVHLLSVPPKDQVFQNLDGEIAKIRACAVTYSGPERVTKAWELSPFLEGFQREAVVTGKIAKVSDFYLWKIVVLELE